MRDSPPNRCYLSSRASPSHMPSPQVPPITATMPQTIPASAVSYVEDDSRVFNKDGLPNDGDNDGDDDGGGSHDHDHDKGNRDANDDDDDDDADDAGNHARKTKTYGKSDKESSAPLLGGTSSSTAPAAAVLKQAPIVIKSDQVRLVSENAAGGRYAGRR